MTASQVDVALVQVKNSHSLGTISVSNSYYFTWINKITAVSSFIKLR